MKSEIISISPIQAEKWLDNKSNNRKLSKRHVEYLTNEILSGKWRLTHQGVAFGDDGRLLDGQHRLAAIVEAGIATNMMVTTGVPVGEFAIIDRGMPRNISVITGIPAFFTECYVFMLAIKRGNAGKPSPDDIFRIHEYLGDTVQPLQDKCNSLVRFYSSAPIRTAAFISLEYKDNKDYILNTYQDLVLQNLSKLPPIALALVKWYNKSTGLYRKPNTNYLLRVDTYIRARHIFQMANATLDQIRITEDRRRSYTHDVIDIVDKVISMGISQESKLISDKLKEKEIEIIDKNAKIRKMQEKLLRKTAIDIDAENIMLSREARG